MSKDGEGKRERERGRKKAGERESKRGIGKQNW